LLCAVAVALLGLRGWQPLVVSRLRKPLAAGALLAAALLTLVTNGASPALATVGLAAWGMAEVFGVGLGIAAFSLAGLSGALSLAKQGPPSLALGGAVLAAAAGALP
jgi:hypothetical protein